MIFVALKHAKAEPTPIDAVALDQAIIVEVHGFNEIHLFAIAAIAPIFPDQPLAVGEVSGSIILAYWRLSDCKKIE
ncbi:hypothetical protein [Bradyrhizobium sp. LMG 9283]|uniref:hypothetical protein n=1 Tax=Bradyrhizobium sp. LMG 9283 TaxID=592064 RepID=UPI0038911475